MTEQQSSPLPEMIKHKAIIWVKAEVHDCLPTGECTGSPKYKINQFILSIDGMDDNDAIKRLNETLAELKKSCRAQQHPDSDSSS